MNTMTLMEMIFKISVLAPPSKTIKKMQFSLVTMMECKMANSRREITQRETVMVTSLIMQTFMKEIEIEETMERKMD